MSVPLCAWVVGLTGGIGCGKTAAATAFESLGARIVNADAISRALTGPDGEALVLIRDTFGAAYVDAQTGMDRAAMRALVLANQGAKEALEGILHPMIRSRMTDAIICVPAGAWCIVEVPLLFESLSYRGLFARTVAVDCPLAMQRQRVRDRSGLADQQIEALLHAQVPRAVRLQLADHVLPNSGTLEQLHADVRRLAAQWPMLPRAAA